MFTHDFYATSIEELQLGVGANAIVYSADQATGTLTANPDLERVTELPDRGAFNELVDTFGRPNG